MAGVEKIDGKKTELTSEQQRKMEEETAISFFPSGLAAVCCQHSLCLLLYLCVLEVASSAESAFCALIILSL